MIDRICDDGKLLHQLPLWLRGDSSGEWIVKVAGDDVILGKPH